VDAVLADGLGRKGAASVRLVRGSHVIVPCLYDHDRSYILQNTDGRIVFVIPYEQNFTLIGTTDHDHGDDLEEVRISQEEINYLCSAASAYFTKPIRPDDVVHSYSAVRPLYNDGASKAEEATRDYVLKTERGADGETLLNVFGGKITTYRKLAENALGHIQDALGHRGAPWTGTTPLPGGYFSPIDFESEFLTFQAKFSFLAPNHARRLFRLYGTEARSLLGDAGSIEDLGRCFGADLHEIELRHLIRNEWAVNAEDVLWRRTKLGLRFSDAEVLALEGWLNMRMDDRLSPAAE
jgi:glycerol-3-phosphate dehydrogenase